MSVRKRLTKVSKTSKILHLKFPTHERMGLKPSIKLKNQKNWERKKRTKYIWRTSNQECLVHRLLQLVWTLEPAPRCLTRGGCAEDPCRVLKWCRRPVKWSEEEITKRCNNLSVRISGSDLSARWLLARENVRPCLKFVNINTIRSCSKEGVEKDL